MNIVTGYRGLIGSHVFPQVAAPYGVDAEDCFTFLETFDRWQDVQCVYHMGAVSDTTCTDVQKIYKYNIDFTIKLFELCIKHKVPVKYASSASVYGNTTDTVNPLNFYSLSKATVDLWVEENKSRFAFVQGFRFFNVYGHGEDHKGSQASPVCQFTKQAKTTGVINVFAGSENCVRDFVCVEDVCNVLLNNNHDSGIYDLGTSKPISFLDVAQLVQARHGGEIREIPFPLHLLDRYQYYTCAKSEFDYNFTSVERWLA